MFLEFYGFTYSLVNEFIVDVSEVRKKYSMLMSYALVNLILSPRLGMWGLSLGLGGQGWYVG